MSYTTSITLQDIKKVTSEQKRFELAQQWLHFDGHPLSLSRFLHRASLFFADRIALLYRSSVMTYKDLFIASVKFSSLLRAKGVKKGDRVLVLWENSPEFYIAYCAAAHVGAIVAPLNIFLQERELQHIIADAAPRVVCVSQEQKPKLSEIDCSSFHVVSKEEMENSQTDFHELDYNPVDSQPDELAVLLYTSGTTGMPKGVMLSARNIVTNIAQGIARLSFGLQEGERIFGVLPLFHAFAQFACVWGAFLTGSAVIVVPKIERRYLFENMKLKPTIMVGVPALYGLMALLRNFNFDSVKYIVSGGDALPDKIRLGFALLFGRKICSGYGLTETSPLISVDLEDIPVKTNTVGTAVAGLEVVLKNEAGNMVTNSGVIGELFVKGDSVMLGYYNAIEATEDVMHDGWFATGDLAYFDEQKRIVIAGRAKDVIANKGFKIYPQEIENVIMSHPLVVRVGVIGKPAEGGQIGSHAERQRSMGDQLPVAYVQVRSEHKGLLAELQKLCSESLAHYKMPRSFIITTEPLPATATGKIDKKRLYELDAHSAQ